MNTRFASIGLYCACYANVLPRGAVLAAALFLFTAHAPARAEVSAQDGYGPDGTYQLHVELAPYLWLPATNARLVLGRGATQDIATGVPGISQLTNVLTGAFTGTGLVRFGPWSGELDIDYIGASQSKGLPPAPLGLSRTLSLDVSTVRVAPGLPLASLALPTCGAGAGLRRRWRHLGLAGIRNRNLGRHKLAEPECRLQCHA